MIMKVNSNTGQLIEHIKMGPHKKHCEVFLEIMYYSNFGSDIGELINTLRKHYLNVKESTLFNIIFTHWKSLVSDERFGFNQMKMFESLLEAPLLGEHTDSFTTEEFYGVITRKMLGHFSIAKVGEFDQYKEFLITKQINNSDRG